MHDSDKIKNKVYLCIAAIAVLFIMLSVTTYALITTAVSIEDNSYDTATVSIGLNGGEVIFDGSDMNIEPGQSVKREFTVENKSSVEIFYRLYLENVSGSLSDVLNFDIYDGDELIYSGIASKFDASNACVGIAPLKVGEVRTLCAVVTMSESAGNEYKNGSVSFDTVAQAVQAKNNTNKAFE